MSSDEEDMPDDADATDARKKARQGDDDFGEEMSDEEVDLAKVKYQGNILKGIVGCGENF